MAFAVLQLNKSVEVEVMNLEVECPLVYADGMIGAIPVFETREAAEKFAGDKYEVAELKLGSIDQPTSGVEEKEGMAIEGVGENVLMLNEESMLKIINEHFKYNLKQVASAVVQLDDDSEQYSGLFKIILCDKSEES